MRSSNFLSGVSKNFRTFLTLFYLFLTYPTSPHTILDSILDSILYGRLYGIIGLTLLYFKMDVMPLIPETKMADISMLISLGNLLTRRTTWLVLKATSATSVFSRVF